MDTCTFIVDRAWTSKNGTPGAILFGNLSFPGDYQESGIARKAGDVVEVAPGDAFVGGEIPGGWREIPARPATATSPAKDAWKAYDPPRRRIRFAIRNA